MESPQALIHIAGLSKSYTQGDSQIQVLNNLNLQVQSGQSIAIVGQSGSGKSTLLSLLAGLDRPQSGHIMVAGQDLTTMNEHQLAQFRAQSLSIVFQQFHLMSHLTAHENVALPLEIMAHREHRQAAFLALQQVGLAHRLQHFPRQLSGGEKQRVAIARAMVVKPRVLLADEPSGNLDDQTGRQVMDLLFQLASTAKTTLILVTHNQQLAARCQRCLHLQAGSLLEEAAP